MDATHSWRLVGNLISECQNEEFEGPHFTTRCSVNHYKPFQNQPVGYITSAIVQPRCVMDISAFQLARSTGLRCQLDLTILHLGGHSLVISLDLEMTFDDRSTAHLVVQLTFLMKSLC